MALRQLQDTNPAKFSQQAQAGEKKWAPTGFAGRGFKFDDDELDGAAAARAQPCSAGTEHSLGY